MLIPIPPGWWCDIMDSRSCCFTPGLEYFRQTAGCAACCLGCPAGRGWSRPASFLLTTIRTMTVGALDLQTVLDCMERHIRGKKIKINTDAVEMDKAFPMPSSLGNISKCLQKKKVKKLLTSKSKSLKPKQGCTQQKCKSCLKFFTNINQHLSKSLVKRLTLCNIKKLAKSGSCDM